MKKVISFLFISVAVMSCSKTETEPAAVTMRFKSEKIGAEQQEILTDNETKLVWVNDARACFAGIVTPGMQCSNLEFGGRTDWRVPSAMEQSVLLAEVAKQKMKLNYINASCALMSSNTAAWVFTENSSSPGQITTAMPGNAGLRCVSSK